MLYSIQYVYGKDKKEKSVLEGAKVISFDGQKAYVQEIYVGLEFTLEDILENKINRNAIGVKNEEVFKSEYAKTLISSSSSGIKKYDISVKNG